MRIAMGCVVAVLSGFYLPVAPVLCLAALFAAIVLIHDGLGEV